MVLVEVIVSVTRERVETTGCVLVTVLPDVFVFFPHYLPSELEDSLVFWVSNTSSPFEFSSEGIETVLGEAPSASF